jgi:hypothetical protein
MYFPSSQKKKKKGQVRLFNKIFVAGLLWFGRKFRWKQKLSFLFFKNELYIRDILADCVVPFAPFLGPDILQDNARPHTARYGICRK